jgi:hypothetical protein
MCRLRSSSPGARACAQWLGASRSPADEHHARRAATAIHTTQLLRLPRALAPDVRRQAKHSNQSIHSTTKGRANDSRGLAEPIMSQSPNRPVRTVPNAPKTESWVLIMSLAFAPVLGALFAPQAARIALLALGAVMFVVGFALMVRTSRASRDSESLRQLVHSGSE